MIPRNSISLAIFFFGLLSCVHSQKKEYRCPPCASDCHKEVYNQPGMCPVCDMELITTQNSKYGGYLKEEIRIANDSIELNAAYYLPFKTEDIKAALIVVHGSAPSTYEVLVAFLTTLRRPRHPRQVD